MSTLIECLPNHALHYKNGVLSDTSVSKNWCVPITLACQHSTHGAKHTPHVLTIHTMCSSYTKMSIICSYTMVLTIHPMFVSQGCRLFECCWYTVVLTVHPYIQTTLRHWLIPVLVNFSYSNTICLSTSQWRDTL